LQTGTGTGLQRLLNGGVRNEDKLFCNSSLSAGMEGPQQRQQLFLVTAQKASTRQLQSCNKSTWILAKNWFMSDLTMLGLLMQTPQLTCVETCTGKQKMVSCWPHGFGFELASCNVF